MKHLFECKVIYEKTAEEGRIVKTRESYVIDALSFSEAEARITKEMEAFISGEFQVKKVAPMRVSEIVYNENSEMWYKARVAFISLDEYRGIERESVSTMLVQADDIAQAYAGIGEAMRGSMADYRIKSISETPIIEVFKYEELKIATEN